MNNQVNMSNWSNATFVFYIVLILLGFLVPKIKYNVALKVNKKTIIIRPILVLFEIFLILVKGLSIVGLDVNNGYYINFQTASSYSEFFDKSLEKGFIFLTVLIHHISNKYWVYLLIISCLTLIPVFYFLNKYNNIVDTGTVLAMYIAIYFFQGLSLIRIALATSIALFAFNSLYEGKKYWAIIFFLLAAQFHASMYVLLLVWLLVVTPKRFKKLEYILISVSAIILYLVPSLFESYLVGRHSIYSIDVNNGLGVMQILYSIPLFLLVLLYYRNTPTKLHNMLIAYVVMDFVVGILSYRLPIGRMYFCFMPISFLVGMKQIVVRKIDVNLARIIQVIILLYCIFRFYIYISTYYNVDEIMPYINTLGWKF